jgi:chromosome segregation ATPase
MSQRLQAQLASSAEEMKGIIEVVDELIKNKRGAKKVSDDHRVQLDSEFTSLCNHVQDLRRDYRKHLRGTEKCKNTLQSSQQKQAKPAEIDR